MVCFRTRDLPLRINDFQGSTSEPVPDGPKPQTGTIVGTVIDVNDDPVPDATIVLEGPVPGDPRQAMSNDNGFFEFKALGPGTYHVTVSAKGFATGPHPL